MMTSFPGSSDEDEDDIFSDDMGERGSDSESGDNIEQVRPWITLRGKIFTSEYALLCY